MLKEYKEKRHFERTTEPAAAKPAEGEGPLTFVVQKHAARRLHYDLRLEFDGVLKSWSLPKGPSLNPQDKRLAVMVEDHPIGYRSFEGNIPKGEYGAGQVIVWDYGDYSPDDGGKMSFGDRAEAEERMRRALEEGKMSVTLRGYKLKGSWTLVRMKQRQNNWLFIKHQDELADPVRDILEESRSILSGLTIEDLKGGKLPDGLESGAVRLDEMPGVHKALFPKKVMPMLAASADDPFSSPGWLFEPKLDGYRVIATLHGGNVHLFSRNGLDVTTRYGGIRPGLSRQPAAQLVLDGEIIALDARGKPCFQCLQGYLESMGRSDGRAGEATAIIYYVFDIIYLDGYELHTVPLILRKKLLERMLRPSGAVRLMAYFEGEGVAIYRGAVDQGLEGVIAKQKDSPYEMGRRSSNWLKVKSTKTEDFIIGGYTQGAGNRARTFGALVLGYYDDRERLNPAGHVGTGFDDSALNEMKKRLDTLKTEQSPFAVMPKLNAPVTWVRPELVVEVKFSQWTRDGQLRAPVYLRLREDKPAGEVRRTQTYASPAASSLQQPPARPDDTVADILEQLKKSRDHFTIEVEGYTVSLSNLDKELWPPLDSRPALTKRELITYLARVSPYLLGHLRDRPLTLNRYPDGIRGEQFFQKHWHNPVPDFVETVPLSEQHQKRQPYLLCNNLATLLWLGQVADLELHTWFSRVSPASDKEASTLTGVGAIDDMTRYPDFMVFDIDPYIYAGTEPPGTEPQLNRAGFSMTCEAALWLKETLDALSLPSFVKTSGRTGLHIYVPLRRQFDYRAVHSAAKTICQFVLQRHPRQITTDWIVERRTGKVFLDYNQNLRGKTLVCVYSPRAVAEATVSTPLPWNELSRAYPLNFTILNLPDRLSEMGDLWANIMSASSELKQVLGMSQ